NLNNWIEENRHLFKPPVSNRYLYDGRDFFVMVIKGPNARNDFHLVDSEEYFYQLKGDMEVRVREGDRIVDHIVREGETFFIPPTVPHSPQRPRNWPDLDAKYGYSGFVRLDHYQPCCARMMIGDRVFREITDNVWDPARRIGECDRDRVSMQVLSTVPVMFSYWAKPADALDLSRRLNDHIAGVVRDHPKRFAGLATIPMQDPDLAAGELERCVRELGLRGAEIGTHVD